MRTTLTSSLRWWLWAAAALTLADGAAAGPDADHRRHDAHVHGLATVNLAVQGDQVIVELSTPAANLVGFEYRPRSDAERTAVDRAVALLQDGALLFRLSPGARCELVETRIESPLLDHRHEAAVAEPHEPGLRHGSPDDHDHQGESHAELLAVYRFRCARPAALGQIEVGLFDAFPATEQLRVQAVTERGQTAGALTASNPRLRF